MIGTRPIFHASYRVLVSEGIGVHSTPYYCDYPNFVNKNKPLRIGFFFYREEFYHGSFMPQTYRSTQPESGATTSSGRNVRLCHPERSRGVWPRSIDTLFAMPDVSTTLRFARHDRRKGRHENQSHPHEARERLESITRNGSAPAKKIQHARVLLMSDQDHPAGRYHDQQIAALLGIHVNTVAGIRINAAKARRRLHARPAASAHEAGRSRRRWCPSR